jgi:hypothetical protein
MSVMEFLAILATSASGFVLSNTLIFSSFQVAAIVDWLSHTCSIEGVEKPYTLGMCKNTVNVTMLPQISALYELTSSTCPSVAPKP